MQIGTIREAVGSFKSTDKRVDVLKRLLTRLGFEETEDRVDNGRRYIHFDGEDARIWSEVTRSLKNKFPRIKAKLNERTDETTIGFEEYDEYDYETLVLEMI